MNAAHLGALCWAETFKLLSRTSARLGLVVAMGLGLAMPLLMLMLMQSEAVVNGAAVAETLDASAPKAALWGLRARNLWLMQAFVLLLATLSIAGELNARTLREDLLRPVPRGAVLLAKICALAVWIGLSLCLQFAVTGGLGLALFGASGPWREALLGFIGSGLADLSFAVFAVAIAALARSTAGTLVGVLLFIVFEKLASWSLFITDNLTKAMPAEMMQLPAIVGWIFELQPALPSAAWGVGTNFALDLETAPITWAATFGYLLAAAAVAHVRLSRLDVP